MEECLVALLQSCAASAPSQDPRTISRLPKTHENGPVALLHNPAQILLICTPPTPSHTVVFGRRTPRGEPGVVGGCPY
eukprot:10897719-Alexandrium_andersonii.AAC.1